MDYKVFSTIFAAVFLAELGDKTQLATMLFASDKEVSKMTLKAFFNTLIRYNYLQENPILAVTAPGNPPKEIIILTDKQVKKFLKKIDSPDYKDLFLVYLHTGARRGEILPERPFTWDNVDFKRREITLIGKKRVPRLVPLDGVAFKILHRRKFEEHREVPFKFNYHFLYKKYLQYLKAAKVKATGLHTLYQR